MKYAADELAYGAWIKARASGNPELIRISEDTLYRILKRYATSVVCSVLRYRDPDLITDIVAHAFEKAHQFKGESKFTTWFYRLAFNMCLRELENRKRRAEDSLDMLHGMATLGLESHALAKLDWARLYKTLSRADQKLLNLKLYGVEEKDIACALKISSKAVNQRWLRLRRHLQSLR